MPTNEKNNERKTNVVVWKGTEEQRKRKMH
jgi:hypothetical protein